MKKIYIFLLMLMINVNVIAQNVKYQNFTSPEVASLASQVQTPVSLSSGAMNIEIPLYTLQEGDIEVPISLVYDATGVRVGSVPGWVGQNWTLKAGGVITRVVNGAPDEARMDGTYYLERNGNPIHMNPYLIGYFENFYLLNSSSWNSYEMIRDVASLVNGIDLEPDEFIFNFCGHSGSFYIDRTGEAKVIGKKGYKIEIISHYNIPIHDSLPPWEKIDSKTNKENKASYTYRNYSSTSFYQLRQSKIVGIKMTDPYGYEYYFGQYEKADASEINHYKDNFDGIEITSTFFGQIYDEIYSTWYLMKIVSPTRREVLFNYENGWPSGTFNTSYTMSHMKVRDDGSSGWLSWFWKAGYMIVNNSEFSIDGRLLRPQILTSIETENYKIDFSTSVSKALDYDYSGQIQSYLDYIARNHYSPNIRSEYWHGLWPVANYKMVYDIALNNSSNPSRLSVYGRQLKLGLLKREKLDEITIRWKHGNSTPIKYLFSYRENSSDRLQLTSIQKKVGDQTIPPYTFTYNNSKKLPAYLDPRTDHWGYYNGNSNLTYNVSNYTGYHSYKSANSSYIDSEILLKIQYPTGGTKEFIYEPNKYTKIVKRNDSSGDLYLETVAETIGGGLRIKEIIEKPDANSKSEHKIYTYQQGILNGDHQYYWPNYQGRLIVNNNTYTATRFYSHSILPVSTNNVGGSVSYSKVTETIPGNGKIERTFTNHDSYLDLRAEACIDPQKTAYSPFTSRAALRGNLLKEEVFKESSTTPVSRVTYTYSSLNTNNYIRAMQTRGYVLFDGNTTNAIEGSSYKIFTDPVLVSSVKEEVFPDNSSTPIPTITNYTYNNYFDIDTEEVIGSSEGAQTKYKTSYLYTHNTSSSDLGNSSVYDRYMTKDGLMNRNMVKLPIFTYNYKNNELDHYIKYRYAYSQFHFGRYFNKEIVKFYDTGLQQLSQLFEVDKRGNPMCISNNGISTLYLWGYNYQFIVAEIKNATLGDIYDALEGTGVTVHDLSAAKIPNMTLINSLRTRMRDSEITTYTYDPLIGVKTATDPNGIITYYNYDVLGRLIEVRDHNNRVLKTYEYHYDR